MNDEERSLRVEEQQKLQEEGDRIFLVRLGRLACNAIVLALVVLVIFSSWMTLWSLFDYCREFDVCPNYFYFLKAFFWDNLVFLILGEMYVFGAFLLLISSVYLFGGQRFMKLVFPGIHLDRVTVVSFFGSLFFFTGINVLGWSFLEFALGR
jgi:hypothetical protein